ncbi:hypothetical protein D9M68_1003130 [compost metagenome]
MPSLVASTCESSEKASSVGSLAQLMLKTSTSPLVRLGDCTARGAMSIVGWKPPRDSMLAMAWQKSSSLMLSSFMQV